MANTHDPKRRALLKGAGTTALALGMTFVLPAKWIKPLAQVGVLPVHAQTSCTTDTITASSLNPPNDFPRTVIIVDSSGNRIADFNASSGTAMASGLAPGNYRVLGDSIAELSHTITVETDCSLETFTVTTTDNSCKTLVATVSIPDGAIAPGNGQVVTGPWSCS